jgi:hypothetical protein
MIINFVPHKDSDWLKMPVPGLTEDEAEALANHLSEKLVWFTWFVEKG